MEVAGAERSRRRVWLVLRAETVEFHEFDRHVRVGGPIVEGPFDQGRYHTLDIEAGDDVTLRPEALTTADRTILEEGVRHQGDPSILVASVDWGDSALVRLRGRSVEPIADLRRTLAGKQFGGSQPSRDRDSYLADLTALLVREGESAQVIALCGPGFLKEALAKRVAEAAPALRARLHVYATAESGRAGVDELLRSGRAEDALGSSIAAEEATLVEALLRGLSHGSRGAVGPADVTAAVDGGAAETVLVLESLLPDAGTAKILDAARAARARVFVVRETEGAGARLRSLGGIAALLRFDWTNPDPKVTGSPGRPRGAPRTGA